MCLSSVSHGHPHTLATQKKKRYMQCKDVIQISFAYLSIFNELEFFLSKQIKLLDTSWQVSFSQALMWVFVTEGIMSRLNARYGFAMNSMYLSIWPHSANDSSRRRTTSSDVHIYHDSLHRMGQTNT